MVASAAMSAEMFAAASVEMLVVDMEQLYVVMSAATSAVVYAAVFAAASVATSAEILVELSLERYAVGISQQAQLVLKS